MIASKPLRHKERKMTISSTGSTASFSTSSAAKSTESSPQTNRRDHTIIDMEGSSQAIDNWILKHTDPLRGSISPLQMDQVIVQIKKLDSEIDSVITGELADTLDQIVVIPRITASLMEGDPKALDEARDQLALNLDYPGMFDNSMHQDRSPNPNLIDDQKDSNIPLQRAQIIVDSLGELLGKLGRNEFEGDLGRLASNLTITGLRTGLIVGTLTTIRQLIGFALEKCLQSNAASPLTRNVIGGVSLMIGPALNILGALRDECNGTANTETRLSRLMTLSLSLAAFAVALVTPQALPALASFGPQMAFFTLARDLTQVFVPLNDNAQINLPGTAANAGLYGALQFLLGTAMDQTAPNSGAGYAMSAGSGPSTADGGFTAQLTNWMHTFVTSNTTPETQAAEILESLAPVLGHDILRGVYNGAVEVIADTAGGGIMHRFQSERESDGFRITFAPRVPSASEVADQLLTTSAMRTSFGGAIMAAAISAGTYFGSLGLSTSTVNHAVNAVVAAVAIAGLPGFFYAHQGNSPVDNTTV
ncbi:hypothetical protein [Pseudomonas sp. FW305-70]|uniref:hypothetical protein n=1 Tax=Pseudomonas sp. FW305-70 TaxID=2751342 RepID=UPI0011AF3463|nr:hypothetical protein [Pseudomonas sp. FW305-70]